MCVTCTTCLHSIGQAVYATQAGMQHCTHTLTFLIWPSGDSYCTISASHTGRKVGQMFSKVNHFSITHQSQPNALFFFFLNPLIPKGMLVLS